MTLIADDASSISAIAGAAAIAGSLAGGTDPSGAVSIGASIAENEIRNEVEAYIANADVSTATTITKVQGTQTLETGDTVKLSDDHDPLLGEPGAIYKFLLPSETVDLDIEDFTDPTRWEQINADITLAATSQGCSAL